MRLKRIKVESLVPGGTGYTYYKTRDGRFTIVPVESRTGSGWQMRATDGSEPFRGWRGMRSRYYNATTLRECREELSLIYEEEG